MATIDLSLERDAEVLLGELRDVNARLERERARNAGLERGISALSARVDALRLENLELRRKLEHCA